MTNNKDIELLAVWINGVVREIPDARDKLREWVKTAANQAAEMYGPLSEAEEEECQDPYDVRSIIGRFAAALDEDEQQRKRDEGD